MRIRNKIFRPGFFGSVVQLADVFQNDVIKTSTAKVIVASLDTLQSTKGFQLLVCVSP